MERDDEQVKFIEEVLAGSETWQEKFSKIVEWRKKNRGLLGVHVSAPLDVMCGVRRVEDPYAEAEKMAMDLCLIALESAKGELKEVDWSREILGHHVLPR